ncbi:tol-pal system protein YbgF [Roseicitreum antarcticum]|uniref:Cell division coordinator CpoB n=2 Tax=Roseicitreum antarcticum TaxID=564137 RepID=A0A1H2XIU3_9RHOB|nr:tol-pal system protein YbgF [Roseicitreum antarcticum]SDW92608.1 tol-pal system protein YbgF [Roseicitreum antarcticum]
MRGKIWAFGLVLLLAPVSGLAQEASADAATLADIRAELVTLTRDVAQLRAELATSSGGNAVDPGQAQFGIGGSLLERADRIEAQLTRLTGLTERLEFRIDTIVSDATNRIGDLEFRLVELEGGDVSQLGQTSLLGGAGAEGLPDAAVTGGGAGAEPAPELATGEQRAFDAARAAFDAGDNAAAVAGFQDFLTTYPGSPLSVDAGFLMGQAHAAEGNPSDAARAYLDAFTAAPDGPRAGAALLQLGINLNALGQNEEACIMFDELSLRFPGSAEATEAQGRMAELSCS